MSEENTKNKLKEIEKFGEEILPEFLEVLKEIQVKNPKMSKIKTFEALFEIGEKKYLSNHPIKDKEFGKDFVRILNKTYMEYSCYLSYGGGCIKGIYGNDLSRKEVFDLIMLLTKVGKKNFIDSE